MQKSTRVKVKVFSNVPEYFSSISKVFWEFIKGSGTCKKVISKTNYSKSSSFHQKIVSINHLTQFLSASIDASIDLFLRGLTIWLLAKNIWIFHIFYESWQSDQFIKTLNYPKRAEENDISGIYSKLSSIKLWKFIRNWTLK